MRGSQNPPLPPKQLQQVSDHPCTQARAPPSAQPLEPMLLPKLRIDFADFPWSHCSIDQRLFTSESGCGYRYGLLIRERTHTNARTEISGRSFVRIAKAPRTARWMRRFPYVFRRLSPSEMRFKASATSKRKDNPPQAPLPWAHRRYLL